MENDSIRPKYCGNLLVRRTKRRSFINKLAFEGVFGVLSSNEFIYYRSSSDWTNQEKPQFAIQLVDIQAVEDIDDVAFSRASCFQIIYTNHSKKDKSIRSIYLAAYEEDEQKSWIKAIRSACLHNPVMLAYFHSGRFTGKTWTCCSEGKLHHGCKPCTIEGLPIMVARKPKFKVSPAIEFHGFTVIANESFDSSLPGFLPFNKGDRLTVTEAAGKQEWKAFSASSTSEYGVIPCQSVSLADISQEPWFFKGIPCGLATALLREQEPGCFILRCHSTSDVTILSFRTEMAIKHVEIVFDESSQKFRIKDGSESVSYANFLQFDTVQQLLDQCKQHPTLGVILDKYPSIETVDELWKINWNEIIIGDELKSRSSLPWEIMEGKFRNQNALIHVRQVGCADSVQEVFTNQARILMTLSHENVVEFYGLGSKGSRVCMLHCHYPDGMLSDYLARNASLLISHPSELANIITQILAGMIYLEEVGVVHGELVAENCIINDKGVVKICGFHCARSSWCCKPIDNHLYSNKVPLIAPEISDDSSEPTSKTDVWVFGLLVYTIITAGQKPINTVEQVLAILNTEDYMEELESVVEVMTSCLRMDPSCRPAFAQLKQRCSSRNRFPSSPSVSSYSLDLEDSFSASNGALPNGLENSMNSEMASKEFRERRYDGPRTSLSKSQSSIESRTSSNLSSIEAREPNDIRFSSNAEFIEKVKAAELEVLKAKALQRRAEADKEEVLKQVREAEKKCLKEVELITRTFICRLNEANDRTTDANEMRYLAEEAKRLAEEKCNLFKYESERTIHDIKTMLEDTMLERDELAESLKSFGMNLDNNNSKDETQERKDSLSDLEKKYQRFISTSDRTIQNMKSQLDEVVHQRDALTHELTLSRQDLRQTRDLLEQVIKEKEDLVFRLEESNCEVEKLEETISRMVHKREKAERERDQLQILTDMSLMKLRHVEKPKKRHSVGSIGTSYEKKDPNLRRLSVQLMNLRTSASKRRQSDDVIYEVSEHSSSEEVAHWRDNSGDVSSSSTSSIKGQLIEQSEIGELRCSTPKELQSSKDQVIEQSEISESRCSTPNEVQSETDLISSHNSLENNDYVTDMLSEDHIESNGPENDSEEITDKNKNSKSSDMQGDHLCSDQVKDVVDNNHHDYHDNDEDSNDNFGTDKSSDDKLIDAESPPSFSIPKVLIDEFAEEDISYTNKNENQSIPGIAISLVDDNVAGGCSSEEEATSERVFVVPFENGDTTMVYSFESDGVAKKGVPQTML